MCMVLHNMMRTNHGGFKHTLGCSTAAAVWCQLTAEEVEAGLVAADVLAVRRWLLEDSVSFVFMACLSIFLACPAEVLPTQWLKTERLPILMGSVQVRSVMSWYRSRTGWHVFQDKTATV